MANDDVLPVNSEIYNTVEVIHTTPAHRKKKRRAYVEVDKSSHAIKWQIVD
jgi:hypothetical protein